VGAMEIQVGNRDSIFTVGVSGELDLYHSFKLKEQILKLTSQPVGGIILNLQGTTYIDSSGVGVLILANSVCKTKKIGFKMVHVHGPVRRVIELTKLLGYLPILNTEEEAFAALGGSSGSDGRQQ
jgi:anti-sigma B factor antagonist